MGRNITDINQILEILKHQGLEIDDSIELKIYIEDNINN